MILSPPLGKAGGTLHLKEPSEESAGDPTALRAGYLQEGRMASPSQPAVQVGWRMGRGPVHLHIFAYTSPTFRA